MPLAAERNGPRAACWFLRVLTGWNNRMRGASAELALRQDLETLLTRTLD
jgi:hypothetical protein